MRKVFTSLILIFTIIFILIGCNSNNGEITFSEFENFEQVKKELQKSSRFYDLSITDIDNDNSYQGSPEIDYQEYKFIIDRFSLTVLKKDATFGEIIYGVDPFIDFTTPTYEPQEIHIYNNNQLIIIGNKWFLNSTKKNVETRIQDISKIQIIPLSQPATPYDNCGSSLEIRIYDINKLLSSMKNENEIVADKIISFNYFSGKSRLLGNKLYFYMCYRGFGYNVKNFSIPSYSDLINNETKEMNANDIALLRKGPVNSDTAYGFSSIAVLNLENNNILIKGFVGHSLQCYFTEQDVLLLDKYIVKENKSKTDLRYNARIIRYSISENEFSYRGILNIEGYFGYKNFINIYNGVLRVVSVIHISGGKPYGVAISNLDVIYTRMTILSLDNMEMLDYKDFDREISGFTQTNIKSIIFNGNSCILNFIEGFGDGQKEITLDLSDNTIKII